MAGVQHCRESCRGFFKQHAFFPRLSASPALPCAPELLPVGDPFGEPRSLFQFGVNLGTIATGSFTAALLLCVFEVAVGLFHEFGSSAVIFFLLLALFLFFLFLARFFLFFFADFFFLLLLLQLFGFFLIKAFFFFFLAALLVLDGNLRIYFWCLVALGSNFVERFLLELALDRALSGCGGGSEAVGLP